LQVFFWFYTVPSKNIRRTLAMSLGDRLARLRREAGAGRPEPVSRAPAAPPLAERIARLQPRRDAGRRPDDAALAEHLEGRVLAKSVIEVERRFLLTHRHGTQPLDALARAEFDLPAAPPAGCWAFVDTETSGLAGGTGTVAFLIGAARVEHGALAVRQWLLTGFGGEAAQLAATVAFAAGAGLVSYNGKSFDLPLLAARQRLHGARDAFEGRAHLDLLHPTRRAFASRWDNCRLATAERRLLGFSRMDDLPGALVPAAWFGWLHRGDWRPLAEVLQHNLWDLVSLAALLPALEECYAAPQAFGADAHGVARAWRKVGRAERALAVLEAAGDGRLAVGVNADPRDQHAVIGGHGSS
jgi:uncharacterized protein YprB with RNaseH-like and TPR domain